MAVTVSECRRSCSPEPTDLLYRLDNPQCVLHSRASSTWLWCCTISDGGDKSKRQVSAISPSCFSCFVRKAFNVKNLPHLSPEWTRVCVCPDCSCRQVSCSIVEAWCTPGTPLVHSCCTPACVASLSRPRGEPGLASSPAHLRSSDCQILKFPLSWTVGSLLPSPASPRVSLSILLRRPPQGHRR